MAKTPTDAPAAPMPADDDAPAGDEDAAAAAGGDDDEDEGEEVLMTICKEADGTYCLYKGDEPEEGEEGEEGAEGEGAVAGGENKQTFDSVGALLKGVLDVLNEDKESAGAPGSADDQFSAGFDESTPKAPAPMAQKF